MVARVFTQISRRDQPQGIELLVEQRAVVNIQLSPASGAKSMTVTGGRRSSTSPHRAWAATSTRGSEELPVNGRDWMALRRWRPACAPTPPTWGRTAGEQAGEPASSSSTSMARKCRAGGRRPRPARLQPRRDWGVPVHLQALRRDAGALDGLQVNAITKSGTNVPAGSFRLFPRRAFNAADFLSGTVLVLFESSSSA